MKAIYLRDTYNYPRQNVTPGENPFLPISKGVYPVLGYTKDENDKSKPWRISITNVNNVIDKKYTLVMNDEEFEIIESYIPGQEYEPLADLTDRIEKRFKVMKIITEGLVTGTIRSMVMSGAAGIGKSFELEKRLRQAEFDHEIDKFTVIKGKLSAVALFIKLYEHCDPGQILILDDCDSPFEDEVAMNLLKSALDTGDRREVTWGTLSKKLEEMGIPNQFQFEGGVVFITNKDFDAMIAKGNRLTPHFKALTSRAVYLNLGVHTPREIMVRINQIIKTTNIMKEHNIDEDTSYEIMDWLEKNYTRCRDLSIRSILKLASFAKTDPENWKLVADVTELR